jgi:hypothetical protein
VPRIELRRCYARRRCKYARLGRATTLHQAYALRMRLMYVF